VLVVDDSVINQRLVSYVLTNWQVSVDAAMDGEQAVERIRNREYDVVLMDVMMPNMGGYEATRKIRLQEGEYYSKLPIFGFTATFEPDKMEECGMTGYISKNPIDQEEMFQVLSKYYKQEAS
jgi:CheY-like chemotaxis protein